jgi:hypothetical protein
MEQTRRLIPLEAVETEIMVVNSRLLLAFHLPTR